MEEKSENAARRQYVVYNNGFESRRFGSRLAAEMYVRMYDGEHEVWYEEEEAEEE